MLVFWILKSKKMWLSSINLCKIYNVGKNNLISIVIELINLNQIFKKKYII